MKYITFYLENCGNTIEYSDSKVDLNEDCLINGLRVSDLKFDKLLAFTQLPYLKIEKNDVNIIVISSKIVKLEYK